MALNYFIRYL